MTPPHFYIFVIISPLKRTWPFIWTNLNSLNPSIICTKFDWIWPAGSREEHFFLNFSAFLLFHYYLPLEKAIPFIWTNLNLLHLRMISAKIGPVVLEEKCFKWPHPIFTFLWLSPLWRGPGPLFEQTWISFYPRIICAKFDWIWPAGSGEEDFLKFFSAFLLFCYYLPLEKGDHLHLNKLETPLPKDDLCKVSLKLAQWFWRRSRKCKSLQTDGRTDRRRTTGDQNSSLELSAQVS
jgi:hypothetical protein